jgi:exosortase
MKQLKRNYLLSFSLICLSFGYLYYDVFRKLIHDWTVDDNYSHGFLIIPISLYLVLERRIKLAVIERIPSNWGLVVILFSMLILLAGILGSELFLTRISILGAIIGAVLSLYGWKYFNALLFPIAFLILMIPMPAIIFNQIAFPLQLLASRFGEWALSLLHIPVLREGNVISLANTSLEVAEACSGIRSLISLLTLGIIYGYFAETRLWIRWVLAVATVPIAILANGIRIAGTGVAAHVYGPEAAEGFFHAFSGWLVFLIAFIFLFVLHRVFVWGRRAKASPAAD